ncbi:MAG: serpin family protein [Candidatus Methylacidiphilales bacterium]|nr:serpin family protein [Candidatus Methylacidiphilales bacterium]
MIHAQPEPVYAEDPAAQASNAFAFDTLNAIRDDAAHKQGNVVFSPFSLWSALTMTSGGAAGSTLKEMQHTLHVTSGGDVHARAGALTATLQATPGAELRVANRLFGEPGFAIVQAFNALMQKEYRAEIAHVPFTQDPAAACKQINKWVAGKTANKIHGLVSPSNIHKDTKLILVNAVYFKAAWQNEFNPELTTEMAFTRASGKTMETPMMSMEGDLPYFEAPGFQAVRLNYKDGKSSCIILLPAEGRKLEMSVELFNKIRTGLATRKVKLRLPRFTLQERLDFVPVLRSLGMKLPFTEKADFSALSTDAREPLVLGSVLHQAFVKLGEKGTEASAATAIVASAGSAYQGPRPAVFIANRPFYFFITQEETGAILFMGKVDKPDSK